MDSDHGPAVGPAGERNGRVSVNRIFIGLLLNAAFTAQGSGGQGLQRGGKLEIFLRLLIACDHRFDAGEIVIHLGHLLRVRMGHHDALPVHDDGIGVLGVIGVHNLLELFKAQIAAQNPGHLLARAGGIDGVDDGGDGAFRIDIQIGLGDKGLRVGHDLLKPPAVRPVAKVSGASRGLLSVGALLIKQDKIGVVFKGGDQCAVLGLGIGIAKVAAVCKALGHGVGLIHVLRNLRRHADGLALQKPVGGGVPGGGGNEAADEVGKQQGAHAG